MKTTLLLDESLKLRVKRAAAERHCSMSKVVEDALRLYFKPSPFPSFPKLPVFASRILVDYADREALRKAMSVDAAQP